MMWSRDCPIFHGRLTNLLGTVQHCPCGVQSKLRGTWPWLDLEEERGVINGINIGSEVKRSKVTTKESYRIHHKETYNLHLHIIKLQLTQLTRNVLFIKNVLKERPLHEFIMQHVLECTYIFLYVLTQ